MKKFNSLLASSITVGLISASGASVAAEKGQDIIENYIALASAKYSDSLATAKVLDKKVDAFLANPSEENLKTVKQAWIDARVPYQQTEVYRFGNAAVDDWEGKVNAWPLDEGLIDYVDGSYGDSSDENPFYTANIIANANPTIGGNKLDAENISKALIGELHEIDEVEANVATGYHVIEFLLWGQDLNGNKPGAGNRPATDFSLKNCSGGNCDRRRDYLKTATALLIDDLQEMTDAWKTDGNATKELKAKGEKGGLATILTGMGSLAYGELAGERTKLGLMLNDPEEEHDCFSDNTHWSHYYDAKGIKNVYLGSYTDSNGNVTQGASLSSLVAKTDIGLDAQMKAALQDTENRMQAMVDQAEKGNTFDVLIGEGNTEGNKVVQGVVDALVAQAKVTEKIIAKLDLGSIELEGSDSLDAPGSIDK